MHQAGVLVFPPSSSLDTHIPYLWINLSVLHEGMMPRHPISDANVVSSTILSEQSYLLISPTCVDVVVTTALMPLMWIVVVIGLRRGMVSAVIDLTTQLVDEGSLCLDLRVCMVVVVYHEYADIPLFVSCIL